MSILSFVSRGVVAIAFVAAVAACTPTDSNDAGQAGTPTDDGAVDPGEAALADADFAEDAADSDASNPEKMMGSMHVQLAEFGGAAQVMAELCGGADAGDLEKAKQEQRQKFIEMGGDAATFESSFNAGYEKASGKLKNATPVEREKSCKELQEMSDAASDWMKQQQQ